MKAYQIIFIRILLISLVLSIFVTDCRTIDSEKNNQQKYNILFIMVDDLRPTLGCYEDTAAVTPNIDQLASNGIVFSRAYCQQAVCAPSRASVMTGLRPDQIRVWDLKTHFRKNVPNVVTLPQYFKNKGYHSLEVGKIYHDPLEAKDPQSWSAPSRLHVTQDGRGHKYVLDINCTGKREEAATEMADVPDTSYIDGKVCQTAVEILNEIKDSTFFLAVGFRRPHLPFSCPKKYWDLYKPDEIPQILNPNPPDGVPEIALHNWRELRAYTDIPNIGDVDSEEAIHLRWGYYAAVSYIDAQIGKLVHELNRLNLAENTIIVLCADHGYHLGEHNLWCKITNFELDTRVPLIISVPNQKNAGAKTKAIVELVDIYPTLADICGLDIPEELAGKSLKPFLNDQTLKWDKPAISQFPRPFFFSRDKEGKNDFMGYSVRTDQYRYTKWIRIETGEVFARELYNHFTDPYEEVNIAKQEDFKEIIVDLDQILMGKISDGYKNVVDYSLIH